MYIRTANGPAMPPPTGRTPRKNTPSPSAPPQPSPATPTEGFTIDNWRTYDLLEYSQTTTATTSFALEHTRAQFCVALVKGDGLTDEELNSASVTTNNIKMLHTNGAHYALFNPDTEITSVEIDINGSKYPYTPQNGITLEKGKCTILTLNVHKADVSGITASGKEWQDVTSNITDGGWTVKNSQGGDLDLEDIYNAKLLITGKINEQDITAINEAKFYITILYITATTDDDIWNQLNMQNSDMRSVYIQHATSIANNAFQYCNHLNIINLPEATSIGANAFYSCDRLTSISLPQAQNIGDNAFQHCIELTSICLPKAQSIGDNAFQYCEVNTLCLPKDIKIENNAGLIDYLRTFFLCNDKDGNPSTEEDAFSWWENFPIHVNPTIYYGYKGTGDYLDPANYEGYID